MVKLEGYDFVDFGCSTGGSMQFARDKLKGERGVGIDIDPVKVEATKKKGESALLADATEPAQFDGRVNFSIMSHFLEHLPDYSTVTKALQTGVHISRSFVFIQQPWFDSDGELLTHGLKFYWSDWSGHTMTLSTLQMYAPLHAMQKKGTIARFAIFGSKPILDSDDPRIVPIDVPVNQSKYDLALHGPKKKVKLATPAFAEQVVIIARKNPAVIDTVASRFRTFTTIYDSALAA